MRQFNYFYSSYIINKHGFFTFIPHANMFHPFFGYREIGFNGDYACFNPYMNFFTTHKMGFKQQVEIFFPEIRTGVIYIDKIQYRIDANTKDDVKIDYKVKKNSKYYDYVEIDNHIAKFEIDIIVDTEYTGIWHPITVSCDYIDILLFQQRISITETQSEIKMIPYLTAYHLDQPLFYLELDKTAISHMKNTTPQYNVILPEDAGDELKKYAYVPSEAESKYVTDVKGKKVYVAQMDAFILNYAIEKFVGELNGMTNDDIFKDNEEVYYGDVLPMFNNNWYFGEVETCKMGIQTRWYYTVYNKRWGPIDCLPPMPCIHNGKLPAATRDETRGDIVYELIQNFEKEDKELYKMSVERNLIALIGDDYLLFHEDYKRKNRLLTNKGYNVDTQKENKIKDIQ